MSLTALAPITVSGTAGPTVTHPAGPLAASVNVVGPAGVDHAGFQSDLINAFPASVLTAGATLGAISPHTALVTADLLLTVSAPGVTVPIRVEMDVVHNGDSPQANAIQVDVGNDGTVEANSATQACCGTVRRHCVTGDAAGSGFVVRIRIQAGSGGGPQAFGIAVRAQPWATVATPVTAACPAIVNTHPLSPMLYTNYQLSALPVAPPSLCELRANGLGRFDAFVISDLSSTLPVALPGPYAGLCNVLSAPLLAVPGVGSGGAGFAANQQFTDWSLVVPALPTGLSLYVQHVQATLGSPFWFGATNALRIDT